MPLLPVASGPARTHPHAHLFVAAHAVAAWIDAHRPWYVRILDEVNADTNANTNTGPSPDDRVGKSRQEVKRPATR